MPNNMLRHGLAMSIFLGFQESRIKQHENLAPRQDSLSGHRWYLDTLGEVDARRPPKSASAEKTVTVTSAIVASIERAKDAARHCLARVAFWLVFW
jgi:hypothetical protein